MIWEIILAIILLLLFIRICVYFLAILYGLLGGLYKLDNFMSENLKKLYEANSLVMCQQGALVYVISMLPFGIEDKFGVDRTLYYPDELFYFLLFYVTFAHPIVFMLYLKYKSK